MTLADIRKADCDPKSGLGKLLSSYLEPVPATGEGMSRDVLATAFNKGPCATEVYSIIVLSASPSTQLQFRHSRLPVDRKLVYIEPSPEHPEFEHDSNEKPDAIQTAIAALSTLPSYQFIRDDIRRILDRNLLIRRVRRILKGI